MRCRALVFSGFVFSSSPVLAQTPGAQTPNAPAPSATAETDTAAPDEKTTEARVHFRNGVKLYGDGNFAGALAEFEAAYGLKPTASSLQNVALCLKALYRYAQAAQTLDVLLERHGAELSDAEHETVRVARDELAALVSTVQLTTSPPDAKVTIDAKAVTAAEADHGILLDVGEHVVEATAPGYAEVRKTIRVAAGEPASLELALRPLSGFIEVRSEDAHAAIAIDGQPRAFRNFRGSLPPGRHSVQIYKPGHRPYERDVVVELGKTAVVEGVPGPPRDADTAPAAGDANKKEPVSGGGWYAFAGLTFQRPTNPPADFTHDGVDVSGGAFGLRGGYRIWKAVAIELMIDGGEVDVQNACDESLGEPASGDCSAPSFERDYSIATFRIGPNLRIMSTSDRIRIVGTLGMGAVTHTFRLGELPDGTGGGKDRSNDPYLMLEVGGEMNLGHVLLGLALNLFFDGGSDLSIAGRDLYPEKSDGLGFVGLSLRGGASQWAPE